MRDGDIVSVSSSSGLGCPDLHLQALGTRFAAEGHPRDLTMLHPIAAGAMYGLRGCARSPPTPRPSQSSE